MFNRHRRRRGRAGGRSVGRSVGRALGRSVGEAGGRASVRGRWGRGWRGGGESVRGACGGRAIGGRPRSTIVGRRARWVGLVGCWVRAKRFAAAVRPSVRSITTGTLTLRRPRSFQRRSAIVLLVVFSRVHPPYPSSHTRVSLDKQRWQRARPQARLRRLAPPRSPVPPRRRRPEALARPSPRRRRPPRRSRLP